MIKIVDYGMGNLRSVQKALQKLGADAAICRDPAELAGAEKMIVPGVGAFRDAIAEVRRLELAEPILEHVRAGKPFLGICLGLQLLFDVSFEDGRWEGLGVIPGKVVRFEHQPDLKIPHMGWNTLEVSRPNPLLEGIPRDAHFYFVHSYYVVPDPARTEETLVAARTEYGTNFVSMIARENLFATQFHPEKSQRAGLKLLDNFIKL